MRLAAQDGMPINATNVIDMPNDTAYIAQPI
jgi:hypothetical protein